MPALLQRSPNSIDVHWRPLVRVMDHPVGFTLLKCHLQGIGH